MRGYMNLAAAEAMLGIHEERVNELMRDGRLRWAPQGAAGEIFVSEEDVRALLEDPLALRFRIEPRARGKPTGKATPAKATTPAKASSKPAAPRRRTPAPASSVLAMTAAERRAAGVVLAGDEALERASVAESPDGVQADIDALVRVSSLRPGQRAG
jgi:hypothetical protein